MSYKQYYISLVPGSRPKGAPQFGSAAERAHYESAVDTFMYLKDFRLLNKLGIIKASLTEEEVEELKQNPLVRSLDKYVPLKPATVTQPAGWALAQLCDRQADEKYTYSMTGEDVNIYVLDDGVGAGAQDYFLGGFERVFDLQPTLDGCNHGTLVASCAAHKDFGVAKKAKILDIKSHDVDGNILAAEGFDAILDHHTDSLAICNMSFGTYEDPGDAISDAIDALNAEGVICIAAAGNESSDDLHYPSNFCLSVAASNKASEAAYFTNFGSSVDIFAPGVFVDSMDKLGTPTLFSGTSAAAPLTSGVAATLMSKGFEVYTTDTMTTKLKALALVDGVTHSLANTTKLLLQASKPVVWEGIEGAADTAFTEKLTGLDFRKLYRFEFSLIENDGTETAITDSTFESTRHAIGTCCVNQGGAFSDNVTVVDFSSLKINPGDNPISTTKPIVDITPGAVVPLYTTSIEPENLLSLSISLNQEGGTATFSTINETDYEIKEAVNLQGLGCLVARIKPVLGPTKEYRVECIVSPEITAEYISISNPYAEDGIFTSVHSLLKEVATKAGISINISVPDVKVMEFIQAGKFSTLLTSLADLLFAQVVQQNGVWYITSGREAIGDFTIDNMATSTYSRAELGDVTNTVLDLLNGLIGILEEKHRLEQELEDLKKELAKAEKIKDDEDDAGKEEDAGLMYAQFLGTASMKFGRANNSQWQVIPTPYTVEGGKWEYWTPEAGKNINPTRPADSYYRVEPVRDSNNELTGEMRGLYNISMSTILVEVQEPSNFGGIYYIRGKVLNFSGGISVDYWSSPTIRTETKLNSITHVYEKRTFFEFRPTPYSGVDEPSDDDREYSLDIEIRYMPSITVPWKFAGSIAYDYWPVKAGSEYVGRIDRDGSFIDPSGQSITTVDDLSEIPGSPVTNELCILNSAGELCAIGTCPGGYFHALDGTPAGMYNTTSHELLSNTSTYGAVLGFVAGELPADHAWVGLGDTTELPLNVDIYFSSDMPGGHGIDFSGYDPDHPDQWNPTENPANEVKQTLIDELKIDILEKENELVTIGIQQANTEQELISYGAASLIPLATTVAEKSIALSDEIERQQKLNIKNQELLLSKQADLGLANDTLYAALSALGLSSVEVTCSFYYNNLLPLPQNDLTISGEYFTEDSLIVTDVNLQLDSKVVSVTAVRRIND